MVFCAARHPSYQWSVLPSVGSTVAGFPSSAIYWSRERNPVRGVTWLPAKQSGVLFLYPTQSAPKNWKSSCVAKFHLVASLQGRTDFCTCDHAMLLREGWVYVSGTTNMRKRRLRMILNLSQTHPCTGCIRELKLGHGSPSHFAWWIIQQFRLGSGWMTSSSDAALIPQTPPHPQ